MDSDAVKFLDGLQSPETLLYEGKAISSNLAFIKDKFSSQKFSCFIFWNNNSKVSKNSNCSVDLGFTEKQSPYTICSFQHLIHDNKNWISSYWDHNYHWWLRLTKFLKGFLVFFFEYCHDFKLTYQQ